MAGVYVYVCACVKRLHIVSLRWISIIVPEIAAGETEP